MRILAILLFAALMSSAATAEPDYLYRGTFTVEVPPRGDAPDWVYRAWLGLTLPYTSKDNYTGCIDVVSRKSSQPHEHYYLVPEEVAIKMLEQHDREAAASLLTPPREGFFVVTRRARGCSAVSDRPHTCDMSGE
jgi:hypothetical protein